MTIRNARKNHKGEREKSKLLALAVTENVSRTKIESRQGVKCGGDALKTQN
jgi:hypothetical protein